MENIELGIVSDDLGQKGFGDYDEGSWKRLGISDLGIISLGSYYDDGYLNNAGPNTLVTNNGNLNKALTGLELNKFLEDKVLGRLDPYPLHFDSNDLNYSYVLDDGRDNISINQNNYSQDVITELRSISRSLPIGSVHKDSKIDFNLRNNSMIVDPAIKNSVDIYINSGKFLSWDVINGAYTNFCDLTYLKSKVRMSATALISTQIKYTLSGSSTIYIIQENNWIIALIDKLGELTWQNENKDFELDGMKLISLEFINGKLRAIPLTKRIDECIISKCIVNVIQ